MPIPPKSVFEQMEVNIVQQLQWGGCEAVPGVPLTTEWWYIRE